LHNSKLYTFYSLQKKKSAQRPTLGFETSIISLDHQRDSSYIHVHEVADVNLLLSDNVWLWFSNNHYCRTDSILLYKHSRF